MSKAKGERMISILLSKTIWKKGTHWEFRKKI